MAKTQFENHAQLRLDLIDGQWRYAVYGPKQSAEETAGLTGKLGTFFPTLDDAIAAFKAEYDVP
jgi:hypothetical protein